ncbi:MAG: carbon starvation protein A [Muribaculaceae bacterium]|nr:carbon starvation protein A [Muribaculaceae bacterium]MBR1474655.1 carbon starvation protein A [Muribaculaceae bacterium]MBR1725407.1 carbon starvation protein A [Muribaculaceae bacterium]
MITFIISMIALVLGYVIYGAIIERIVAPDDRATPAIRLADGVDYVAMPTWKVFMIQFLNIAGTGPIFGAIMGMWFGPAAFLWIVLGCIFAGAVHDYLSGMLSMRRDGSNLPALIGDYLGPVAKRVMLAFTVMLMLMVGAVFVYSPAILMADLTGSQEMWIAIIFFYYLVAAILPIDKIIGKIYPLFAVSLLFMALALLVFLFIKMPHLPELWDITNMEPWHHSFMLGDKDGLGTAEFLKKNPLFPCLFITIACGAISGFHATQSPLMARCLKSERLGRKIFYGSMITEGMVALIWASVSSYFFYAGGWREVVPAEDINVFLAQATTPDGKTLIQYCKAPFVVTSVCTGWLGVFGGILAMLGVVAAPITSGDTALRSARLIIAEALNFNQKTIRNRLMICLPVFSATLALLIWQINNPNGFNVLWQYFGWSNQALSVFTLWTLTVYLSLEKKPYIITLIPAVFMTAVCTTFLLVSPQALALPHWVAAPASAVVAIITLWWFYAWRGKALKQ